MKFYTFYQNNSGGSFDYDKEDGITHFVIIEEENADAANRKAKKIGIYFDGEGDCPCCGDRWSEVDEGDGRDLPMIYDEKAQNHKPYFRWMKEYEVFVHYKNGQIKGFLNNSL